MGSHACLAAKESHGFHESQGGTSRGSDLYHRGSSRRLDPAVRRDRKLKLALLNWRRAGSDRPWRAGVGVHWLGGVADMTKEKPFSATFKLEKETKNTVRYAEEAEGRRPVVGTVYIDKYELGQPYPERIRVSIEPV